ncbi:MAG: HD domain-containing protein [Phocaeicola sp.]|uniref:HD domain-containing protein n=1 Tax=Phocaeicola TaxID=909656 RepID=UPI00234EFB24|nr:HD domain-containing protein [Phocaeicola oris]MCE2616680.1 HD domain-containing protein [Phocaeicola oris]
MDIDSSLKNYIKKEIIPLYDQFDKAHQRSHVTDVINESLKIASYYQVDINMVYTIAAYHDIGLCKGRDLHHLVSGELIRKDRKLRQWFSEEEIEIMAEAAEDHRASNDYVPRSIYGKIVAEADKELEPMICIRRAVQYNMTHYPELNFERKYQQIIGHLKEKYGESGYMKLWIPESNNATYLSELRQLIKNEIKIRPIIENMINEELEKELSYK